MMQINKASKILSSLHNSVTDFKIHDLKLKQIGKLKSAKPCTLTLKAKVRQSMNQMDEEI